ncbi:unnamed protein product [Bursaphelenchus okinawaensis]|uniref:Uncharacterized protein n=1 Tax=Bursaphelenchus okinawaensis TaxID=465554 RepID=A0A811LPT2_9BILA|nr:unnamed protein product [Bursaphelenchus okinawaensis]CAG9126646.1 unnamed protein product [Bursaphelenchus okinawaensis]
MGKKGCVIATGIVAILLLSLAVVLLVLFPFLIYPYLVRNQIEIKQDESGMFAKPTYYWARPPAKEYLKFNMFNVTNAQNVTFLGLKVKVEEKGPYVFRQRDTKQEINFGPNSDVNYKVSKQWVFDEKMSCESCTDQDTVYLPNLSLATLRRLLFENVHLTDTQLLMADLSSLLLGVYPYREVKVMDTLFWGYTDAMVDFLNSRLKNDLEKYLGKPILGFESPQIDVLGFFPWYNNTDDGVYEAYTGADEIQDVGLLKSWAGNSTLGWWNSDYANNVDKTTDGVLSGSFLKDESLTLFQSFLCRHFALNNDGESTVEGIDAINYKPDPDSYNAFKEQYNGYVYNNDESTDFYPTVCDAKKCELEGCDRYCNNRTGSLPPGIHQHVCFPGRRRELPFLAFDSLPHFLNTPPEVQKSIDGLNPDSEKHDIGMFQIQPTCGSTLKGQFRNQFSIAVINDDKITTLKHTRNNIVPCFWLQLDVTLEDYAYDFLRTNMTIVPYVVFYLGIAACVFGILVPVSVGLIYRYRNRK